MKNAIKISVICLLSVCIVGCSSDDAAPIDPSQAIKEIEGQVQSGTWRITNYVDSGKNETNDYTGYDFTFNNNGSLTATNGTNTINGTWSITRDNDSDDDSSNDNDIDFNISFTSPPDFQELSDDWDIVTTSNTKIDLIDVSGGNGDTDILVFEKN